MNERETVTPPGWSQGEKKNPPLDVVKRLAKALRVPVTELLR